MEKGVNRVITIKWPRTLFLQRRTAPRSGRFRRNEVRRKIYDRILYATAKLRASWGGARTMLSSRSRDEWESAVRILIPWLKFARRSSIRSSESFERLRQRRESCLIRWGEKSRWKWYIVSPHLGQFISIPFIFFFLSSFDFSSGKIIFTIQKHDFGNALRLIRKNLLNWKWYFSYVADLTKSSKFSKYR